MRGISLISSFQAARLQAAGSSSDAAARRLSASSTSSGMLGARALARGSLMSALQLPLRILHHQSLREGCLHLPAAKPRPSQMPAAWRGCTVGCNYLCSTDRSILELGSCRDPAKACHLCMLEPEADAHYGTRTSSPSQRRSEIA